MGIFRMQAMPTLLTTLRTRARLTAWLGLLALCAQLLAGGMANRHHLQRLTAASGLLEICSSTSGLSGNPDDPASSGTGSTAQHCPFCLVAGDLPLPACVQPETLPAPTRALALAAPRAGTAARAPDLRHAPARAPPFFA